MSRIIYCPSSDLLDEAEKLAKELKLPILVGDSPQTVNLNFDKSKVQTINTGTYNVFESNEQSVINKAHSLRCTFFEDFSIEDLICLYTFGDGTTIEGLPVMVEKRYVKYIARLPFLGNWHVVLKNKQNIVGEGFIDVVGTRFG